MDIEICYVILHYKDFKLTSDCVDSLLKAIGSKSKIIIIDNGSQNGSYEQLNNLYCNAYNVELLKCEKNEGFARGNNYGYAHAKSYNPSYIIFCNNDLIFEDYDFEKKLCDQNKTMGFNVFGPDIVNLEGIHQNPHRNKILTLKEIRTMNVKKSMFLSCVRLKKYFRPLRKVLFLENLFEKPSSTPISTVSDYPVLQGSCIGVDNKVINEQNFIFCNETFLYFEEDLLTLKCLEHGYKIGVLNNATVKHLEGGTTKSRESDVIDTWIFRLENLIASGRIYERKLKEYLAL